MSVTMPDFGRYAARVPKEPGANIRFRRGLRARAEGSTATRESLWLMCRRDPLFWINAFCWTVDPRKTPAALPFITWPFQDRALREMFESLGSGDIGIKKSRDMGASWLMLLVFDHSFVFQDNAMFLLVSRKKELVDNAGDPDSLMVKLDFNHEMLPEWMQPRVARADMRMKNLGNGSIITGETTTGDAGRGGRKTGVLLDEFASIPPDEAARLLAATADVTQSRYINSTPKGAGNPFYDLIHRDSTRVITMHWSDHPEKAAGLYRATENEVTILRPGPESFIDRTDPSNPVARQFPEDYPFVRDGRLRSPWYDGECRRRDERQVAQELDINFHGSDYTFFPGDMLDKAIAASTSDPIRVGTLDFDPQTGDHTGWMDNPSGFGRLWVEVGSNGKPPPGTYGAAADIGMGTGATPSTIVVGNLRTREKVAEFVFGLMPPDRWAEQFVAVCRWFEDENGSPARAIWEANGPGRAFGDRVMDLRLPWVYWRRPEMRFGAKPSDYPGWWNNSDSATTLFNDYRAALRDGRYKNPSVSALNEARSYVVVVGSSSAPVHSRSQRRDDPTSARDNHGDVVVADAMLCKLMDEAAAAAPKPENEPPVMSIAYRRQQRRRPGNELEHDPRWAVA